MLRDMKTNGKFKWINKLCFYIAHLYSVQPVQVYTLQTKTIHFQFHQKRTDQHTLSIFSYVHELFYVACKFTGLVFG